MFAVFPSSTLVTLQHKEAYEKSIAKCPPVSDITFPTLMIWWNMDQGVRVSTCNGNLLIYYHSPYDPDDRGWSVIGTERVDDTVRLLLSTLSEQGDPSQLVHVPEFVVEKIKNPEGLLIHEEEDYNEYLIPVERLYPLEATSYNRRARVRKFLTAHEDSAIISTELDLSDEQNRKLLLGYVEDWAHNFSSNDPRGDEQKAMQVSLTRAVELGIQNRCLFIDGELRGFFTFHMSHDGKYLIGNHFKAVRNLRFITEYMEFLAGETAHGLGASFINLEMDLGIPGLRTHKTELKPTGFFRKYRITLKG